MFRKSLVLLLGVLSVSLNAGCREEDVVSSVVSTVRDFLPKKSRRTESAGSAAGESSAAADLAGTDAHGIDPDETETASLTDSLRQRAERAFAQAQELLSRQTRLSTGATAVAGNHANRDVAALMEVVASLEGMVATLQEDLKTQKAAEAEYRQRLDQRLAHLEQMVTALREQRSAPPAAPVPSKVQLAVHQTTPPTPAPLKPAPVSPPAPTTSVVYRQVTFACGSVGYFWVPVSGGFANCPTHGHPVWVTP